MKNEGKCTSSPTHQTKMSLSKAFLLDPRTVIIFQSQGLQLEKPTQISCDPATPKTKCHVFFFEGMKITIRSLHEIEGSAKHVSNEYAYDYAVAKN